MILQHRRGDTFKGIQVTLTEVDEDGVLIGPVDLTGAVIVSQLKKATSDDAVALEFSTTDGTITITDPVNGVFSLVERIIDIMPRVYVFDVQITFADGTVQTPIDGTFEILADVTRI